MDLTLFPAYYQAYSWNKKHALFGYPADSFPRYEWIASLERRFDHCAQIRPQGVRLPVPIYLIKEMIQWGGSQSGRLQDFEDGIGELNLNDAFSSIVRAAINGNRQSAIKLALGVPGMGLSYASKLLRFIRPSVFGALDNRIRAKLTDPVMGIQIPRIYDGNQNSMASGYMVFLNMIDVISAELVHLQIQRPVCDLDTGNTAWRPADIEMAIFQWSLQ